MSGNTSYRQKKYRKLKKPSPKPGDNNNAGDQNRQSSSSTTSGILSQDEIPNNCNYSNENNSFNITFSRSDNSDVYTNEMGVLENVNLCRVTVTNGADSDVIGLNSSTANIEYNDSIENQTEDEYSSNDESVDQEEDVLEQKQVVDGLKQKLQQWTRDNLDTLRLNVITKLLKILKSEGHVDLPSTAQTLLHTVHIRKTEIMKTGAGNDGNYIYLGIKSALMKQINSQIYTEPGISVLIHIDGIKVNNSSSLTIWPIVMKVVHRNYYSKPAVVALYSGDSKPASASDFLNDFVDEANQLSQVGVELDGKIYSFKILSIIADAQARSFLKNCKSAGGFWACERCTVKGQSAGIGRKQTRIYPDINALPRTKESFITRLQKKHHLSDCQSSLELLTNFDPVHKVVLDSMHLFYCRVMSRLLSYWVTRPNPSKLRVHDRRKLKTIMLNLKTDIPMEFQRKIYDIGTLAQWKATMYRFFLLYCGPVILKNILPVNQYKHFLLLSVACRILNDDNLAVTYADYAKELLRIFFRLLPNYYGIKSQVLSMHNLIHVADDVKTFQMPLVELSAFWGENYIGLFRKLIKSPKKPLTQVVNRLSEMETKQQMEIKKKLVTVETKLNSGHEFFQHNNEQFHVAFTVKLADAYTLKSTHPDNIVILKNKKIFKISQILIRQGESINDFKNIFLLGYEGTTDNVFNYPTNSSDLNIFKIKKFSKISTLSLLHNVKA